MQSDDAFPAAPAPATTIDDVLARMTAIEAELPAANGVACFNRLYRVTTEAVYAAAKSGTFADVAFMLRLDVIFANRYFDALARHATGDGAPSAWEALFEARGRAGVLPIQFALAGMNAHINFDLGTAVVMTCEERGVAPVRGSAQHEDYVRLNVVLADTEQTYKASFLSGALAELDKNLNVVGSADNLVAMWSIVRARDAAWTTSEVLWTLREHPALSAAYTDSLDSFVGFAGRGLLHPVVPPSPPLLR